jgi:hypothetical protein
MMYRELDTATQLLPLLLLKNMTMVQGLMMSMMMTLQHWQLAALRQPTLPPPPRLQGRGAGKQQNKFAKQAACIIIM